MYIVFEGIDLVGKTTQVSLLREKLSKNRRFIFTKEPGGTELGKKIRNLVLKENIITTQRSEFLLFLADRSEHFQRIVKPNLNKNNFVVSDRSLISGLAYAEANDLITHQETAEELLKLNLFATENTIPDKAIFIQISPDELNFRYNLRRHDNIEKRGFDYLLTVQENTLKWLKKLEVETLILDASDSREENQQKILDFVENSI